MSESIAPRILNLGTRSRWVVSFTPRPFCSRNLLGRRWSGPQIRSGHSSGEEKCPFIAVAGNWTPVIQTVA